MELFISILTCKIQWINKGLELTLLVYSGTTPQFVDGRDSTVRPTHVFHSTEEQEVTSAKSMMKHK